MIARNKDITLQINEVNRKWKRSGASFNELKDKAESILKNLNISCNQLRKTMATLNPKITIGDDRSATYFIQWKIPKVVKRYLTYVREMKDCDTLDLS